jgi:hypothetical protein
MAQFPTAKRHLALHYAPRPTPAVATSGAPPANRREALDSSLSASERVGYRVTAALDTALEQYVEELRLAHQSSDAVIAEIDHAIRVVQPAFQASADDQWKAHWDAYFGLYDALIQRAVITYFVNANNDDLRS